MTDNRGKRSVAGEVVEGKPDAFREVLYANILFWTFLAVVAVIAFFSCGAVWDDVTEGVMEFLFLLMGGGFTLVSALDHLYDKYKDG